MKASHRGGVLVRGLGAEACWQVGCVMNFLLGVTTSVCLNVHQELEAAFQPDTSLVSVMAVNNEIGVKQPIRDIGK